jgi:hypothetical protein
MPYIPVGEYLKVVETETFKIKRIRIINATLDISSKITSSLYFRYTSAINGIEVNSHKTEKRLGRINSKFEEAGIRIIKYKNNRPA